MKKKDLKKRIKDLESLVAEQRKIIDDLKYNQYFKYLELGGFKETCYDGKDHEYPLNWLSISRPHCIKCGKQAPNYEITYRIGDIISPMFTTISTNNTTESLN